MFGHKHMTRHILLWITIIDLLEYRVTLTIDKDSSIKNISERRQWDIEIKY